MTKKRPNTRNTKSSANSNDTVNNYRNILQANRLATYGKNQNDIEPTIVEGISSIKSILDDCKPGTSGEGTSGGLNTAVLYNELDSFRQKWKREIGEAKQNTNPDPNADSIKSFEDPKCDENKQIKSDDPIKSSDKIYAKAKTLFLKAVDLERDEMHLESIRYYKDAMRLCPDIEKQIFQEQCQASVQDNPKKLLIETLANKPNEIVNDEEQIPIYDRIAKSYHESNKEKNIFSVCRPSHKTKGTHISDLPQELLTKLLYYIIGEELDLASLECMALTCRGFYLISRDTLLWRSICYHTWGCSKTSSLPWLSDIDSRIDLDWRQVFMNTPRVNFDGVYISKTRYVRLGDVGFTDLTYRPFHTVRYYRYLRFFPNKKIFILTTNEEPEKIVPIFRHAKHIKQFSSDLSVLEGTFEFLANEISIVAEKDCTITPNQKGQPQYWSRQTPISQKLNMKLELKTSGKTPFKNDALKWLEYTILTKLETGQELNSFDLTPDMFPNLIFARVKRFNMKSSKPLSSQR